MIKNYTTKIRCLKTAGEISAMLAEKGASSIQIRYDASRQPESVCFSMEVDGREWFYRLPCNWMGVQNVLVNETQPRYHDDDHARRVAWRIVKDWIDAQLAIIEAGAADLGQVFLPYLMLGPNLTVYDSFCENQDFAGLLTAGPDQVAVEVVD